MRNNVKTSKLLRYLEKTSHKNEDVYSVVGSEIRYRRLSLSRTLASFNIEGLSVSHLCKIEKNQIVPKKHILNEICKSLEIDDEKIDVLLSLKSILDKILDYYVQGKLSKIEEAYKKGKGLINYRFMIVEFIYYISFGYLTEATIVSHKLLEFANVMNEPDIKIFSLFYGILLFYNEDYHEAVRVFNKIEKTCMMSNTIKIIASKYMFTLYAKINHLGTAIAYHNLIGILIENGLYDQIEDVNFDYAIFLLRNNCLFELSKIYKNMRDRKYKRTISLYTKLTFNTKIQKKDIKDVLPYYYFLGLLKINKEQGRKELSNYVSPPLDYRFEYHILHYLTLSSDHEKFYYIKDELIPVLKRSNNGYVNSFFHKEFNRISIKEMKYKDYTHLMGELTAIVC